MTTMPYLEISCKARWKNSRALISTLRNLCVPPRLCGYCFLGKFTAETQRNAEIRREELLQLSSAPLPSRFALLPGALAARLGPLHILSQRLLFLALRLT